MNVIRLAWKNILHRPLSALLSVLLLALGAGLVTVLLLVNSQLEDQFQKNLKDIDLVVGAKGSPLQLLLSSVYHVDAPTGNIKLQEAKPYLREDHPLIKRAVPLGLGDSWRGNRIVGTTIDFLELYDLRLKDGRLPAGEGDVLVGDRLVRQYQLKVGQQILSSHGYTQDSSQLHDEDPLTIVGTLESSGTVADQLVITSMATVWHVHGGHGDHEGHDDHDLHGEEDAHAGHDDAELDRHDHSDSDVGHHEDDHHHAGSHDDGHHTEHNDGHDEHDHSHHDHSGHHSHHQQIDTPTSFSLSYVLSHPEEEITSMLLTFEARNFQALSMPRAINEYTGMMAANPVFEVSRLRGLLGTGTDALRYLGFLIMLVAGLSVFFALFDALNRRKPELALMRAMGAGPGQLFSALMLEGLMLSLLGAISGLLIAHLAMIFVARAMYEGYGYTFSTSIFLPQELLIALVAIMIGLLASAIPAYLASRTDIAEAMQEGL